MKSETILLGSCLRRIDTLQKRDLISRQRDARVLTKLQIVAQNEGVPITNGRIIVPSLVHSGLKTLCRRDQVNQKVYVLLLLNLLTYQKKKQKDFISNTKKDHSLVHLLVS